jgi:chromosome segregation ATPase
VEQAIANYRVEVVEAGKEKKKLEKLMVLTTTKLEDLAREKEKIELKAAALEAKKLEHETAIARTRKAEDFTKKQIDLKRRERATLNRGLGHAKTDSDAMKEMLIVQSNSSKNLESEVLSHQAEALEKRDTIVKIEMERDKHAAEAAAAQEQYEAARDEVEKAEEAVAGVQRRIVDSDARLKQQKALFEAVRADRNVHSKHLLAAQSDIAAMKRKFRLMSRTISQLKDDIMSKERELLRERTQRSLVDKQRERLKAELSRIDKMIKSSGKILVGQKGEISALSEVVQKGDAELTRQEKEYNSVMHERDILRTQLMQRDAEFATLSEKVKLQRSMLAQGTSQFVDLKRQSAGLDQTLENESLNLVDLQKQTEGIDGLRNDMCVRVKVKVGGERASVLFTWRFSLVFFSSSSFFFFISPSLCPPSFFSLYFFPYRYRLERDLIAEQTKIKALSEELERPLNIHRWRALEGSDPERFALLKRVATLQKRLITKTEEVAKTGLLIQQKEQAYNDLKQLLERRPGQDVAEQLAVYQSNLKDKKRNCRQVEEEVLRYKQEVSDHRNVLRSLHTRMDELKQLYFVEARRGGGRGGSLRFPQMESGGGGGGVAGKMQLDAAPGSEAPSTLFFGHGEATEGGGMRTVPPLDSSDDDDEY